MGRSVKYAAYFALLILGSAAQAQIPQTMSYQGILTDGSGVNVPDGNYNLTFKLYDVASGPNPALWSEAQLVQVSKGIFNVMLGSTNPLNLPFDKQYWLGISVGLNPELTPRVQLASAPYSLSTKLISNGQAVRSLNGLTDAVTLTGAGGATVTSSGNTITITASGGSGTGIQGVQNTNNTLDITNGTGPTATINVRNQGITTTQLADDAVTGAKIASGQTVKSINTLHDDITLNAGTNVTITPGGNGLTISATGGSGGLSAVSHNASLNGDGTSGNPLSLVRPLSPGVATAEIADNAVTGAKIPTGQVVKSINTIRDDVTLAPGANVTITPSGNTLTIAATGGGGGLTLPYAGTANAAIAAFDVENTGAGKAGNFHVTNAASAVSALAGITNGDVNSVGVEGRASAGVAVSAINNSNTSPALYVRNDADGNGLNAGATGSGVAVNASSTSGIGVSAITTSGPAAVSGECNSTANGVYGVIGTISAANIGKYSAGIQGICNSTAPLNRGVYGYNAGSGTGVYGQSASGVGIFGTTATGLYSIMGTNSVGSADAAGVYGDHPGSAAYTSGVKGVITGTSPFGYSAGVRGINNGTGSDGIGVWGSQAGSGWGVYGESNGIAVYGLSTSGTGVRGISSSGSGITGESTSGNAIYGTSHSPGLSGVVGLNNNSGTGVWGESSGAGTGVYARSTSGNALEVAGPIKVSGSNKAAFVWTTSAGNITGNRTILSYTGMSNTDILIVTHNYQASYLGNNAVGVWWNGAAWTIYLENGGVGTMPTGEKFNVLVIKQ